MTKKNKKRLIIIFKIIIAIGLLALSNFLVRKTLIVNSPLFNIVSLCTIFAILIGFSLTIYTFGLSLITDIKDGLNQIKSLEDKKRDKLLAKLVDSFSEIKEDIWVIFISLVLVILFGVIKEFPNPFNFDIGSCKIPETAFMFLLIVAFYSMYDIMKALFHLSEIKLTLINYQKSKD